MLSVRHGRDWENGNAPFRGIWGGGAYVFLEDEAGQQGGGLLHRQVVEEAVENHLCQQELVAAGDAKTRAALAAVGFQRERQQLPSHLLISQATRPFTSMTSEGLANPSRLRTRFLHFSWSICRTV